MSNEDEKVSIWSVEGWFRYYVFPVYVPITFALGFYQVWCRGFPDKWLDRAEIVSEIGMFSVISLFVIHEGVSFVTLAVEYFRKNRDERVRRSEREKILNLIEEIGGDIDEQMLNELKKRLNDGNY